MEKTLKLELDRTREKPVFTLETRNSEQIRCLVDSGAAIPVWCGTELLLKSCFDVKKLNKKNMAFWVWRNGRISGSL